MRRLTTVLGLTLVFVGLCLVAYVGWQFFGTNYVAHHRQQQTVAQVEQAWRRGAKGPVLTRSGEVKELLHVPRFGKTYLVPIVEGTDETQLANGVGHYIGTASVGQRGNFALAGHRVTHGEPFSSFPELQVGDQVQIETSEHVYTYIIDNSGTSLIIPLTDTWVLAPHPKNPRAGINAPSSQRLITLTTCSELFHTENRSVVFGHLVTVANR